jgi:hypothetical protein
MDDDLQERFDAVSLPELRRRVDLAVRYLRELRSALAVESGMILENAPGPIPKLDMEQAQRALEELMAMLPLLRKPLTPEQRAKMRPVTAAGREKMKEALDELVAADPEILADLELEVSHEQLVLMREGIDKSKMLDEVERELVAYVAELKQHRERLGESVAALVAKINRGRGEA